MTTRDVIDRLLALDFTALLALAPADFLAVLVLPFVLLAILLWMLASLIALFGTK